MNDRVHWGRRAKSTAMVRLAVFAAARRFGIPPLERCRVDVVWVWLPPDTAATPTTSHPSSRRSTTASAPIPTCPAHIVPDDAPAFMDKPSATIRHDKTVTPHFEVTITDLS